MQINANGFTMIKTRASKVNHVTLLLSINVNFFPNSSPELNYVSLMTID